MTQTEQILKHLKSGRSLTVLTALEKFGCYALSQRVGELKRAGKPVGSTMVRLKNGKRVARYFWAGKA